MAAKNDITGDSIQTRGISNAYRDNYDLIFGKKKKEVKPEEPTTEESSDGKETKARSGNN